MFNLKIAAFAGAFLFAFAMGGFAEAATIKKRAGVTYSCTVHRHYEKCVVLKKKRVVKRKHTQTRKAALPQAEWPSTYDTTQIHSVASRFVGLHERKNRGTLKAVVRVDPAITAWCAAFVNAMLEKSGIRGTNSNLARSFLRYGVATRTPRKGDIVVLGRHVGFYEGHVTRNGRTYVAVLGGNQGNSVRTSYFLASKVLSYRRVA